MSTYLSIIPQDICWFLLMGTDPIHLVALRKNCPELAQVWDLPNFLSLYRAHWIPLLEEIWQTQPTGEFQIRTLVALTVFGVTKVNNNWNIVKPMIRLSQDCQDHITSQFLIQRLASHFSIDHLGLLQEGWTQSEVKKIADVHPPNSYRLYRRAIGRPEVEAQVRLICDLPQPSFFLRYLARKVTVEQYAHYESFDLLPEVNRVDILRDAVMADNLPLIPYLLDRFKGSYTQEDLTLMAIRCDDSTLSLLVTQGICLFDVIVYATQDNPSQLPLLRRHYDQFTSR